MLPGSFHDIVLLLKELCFSAVVDVYCWQLFTSFFVEEAKSKLPCANQLPLLKYIDSTYFMVTMAMM